jgi:hypothetical protein
MRTRRAEVARLDTHRQGRCTDVPEHLVCPDCNAGISFRVYREDERETDRLPRPLGSVRHGHLILRQPTATATTRGIIFPHRHLGTLERLDRLTLARVVPFCRFGQAGLQGPDSFEFSHHPSRNEYEGLRRSSTNSQRRVLFSNF